MSGTAVARAKIISPDTRAQHEASLAAFLIVAGEDGREDDVEAAISGVRSWMFLDPDYAGVFDAVRDRRLMGERCGLLDVKAWGESHNASQVANLDWLARLMDLAPVRREAGVHHASVIREAAMAQEDHRKRAARAEWVAAETRLADIGSSGDDNVLSDAFFEKFLEHQSKPIVLGKDVIRSHLPTWNVCCRDEGGGLGLAMGWHTILAANPGAGKSITALNMGGAAMNSGDDVGVGFVSLEMGQNQLATRLFGILTGINLRRLERGPKFDPEAVHEARRMVRERFGDRPFLVNDSKMRTGALKEIDGILSLLMKWKREGCRFFVIDYMQLAGRGSEQEIWERVSRVSQEVNAFAMSEQVVTLGLSQFNRETSKNYKDTPKIQGLAGSSGLENDAAQVGLIDHSRYERIAGAGPGSGPLGARTWFVLGKNRHGATVEIPIWIDYRTLRITEALPHEEEEWPGYPKQDDDE